MTTRIVVGAISTKAHHVASDLLESLLLHRRTHAKPSTAPPLAQNRSNDAARIPLFSYTNMLEEAAQQSGRAQLGLEMAAAAHSISPSIFGDLFDFAPSAGDALGALVRFFPAAQTGTTVKLEKLQNTARFVYNIDDLSIKNRLQDSAYTLGKVWRSLRRCTGERWALDQVSIAAKCPDHPEAYKRFFGAPVQFDAPTTALWFSQELLLQPIATANPARFHEYCKRMELQMHPNSEAAALLQAALSEWMRHSAWQETSSLENAAASFGTTARTLQRRLKAQGINFQELRAQVRMDMAQQLLQERELSITLIAEKLGFSESSAFTRAFRHHAQQSPRQFRQSIAVH